MRKKKRIKLAECERIIAVVPEYASGPGWSNSVLWVYIVDTSRNHYRCVDIQPDERTAAMHWLFATAAAAHDALRGAVNELVC